MKLGPGLMSLVGVNSNAEMWVPLYVLLPPLLCFLLANSMPPDSPIPFAIGIGLLYAGTVFPVLAPLSPSFAGPPLAFLVFVHNPGNAVGTTVLYFRLH